MSFENYGLSPELVSGLADVRIEEPTPLQQKVLPAALDGKHLLVHVPAEDEGIFLIPALQKAVEHGEAEGTKVLILTPSIERAAKIDELVWAIGYHAQISSALVTMSGDKAEHEQAVEDGAPVIIANPGRLTEILDRNNIRLQNLHCIVIDEAHNMENFHLVDRVKNILRFVDSDPQVLILSESNNSATQELVKYALKNPELIGFEGNIPKKTEETPEEIPGVDLKEAKAKLDETSVKVVLKKDQVLDDSSEPISKGVEQGYINVPARMKISTLMAHLEESDSRKIVVFAASGRTTDRLFRIIRKKNWGVVSLSEELDEKTYAERLERFNSYDMRILLIGGIPGKKIHIGEVNEVINYDVPEDLAEYRYRAEMVGEGKASRMISLVYKMDFENMEHISKEAGYPPIELPFPEEVIEKRKKKAPAKSGTKVKQRNGKQSKSDQKKGKKNGSTKKNQKKKTEKPKSLPRPTYEGLSGGREGKPESSTGVFGWVKKLFD
ncbi:MAG: DEAD/DEAH box helicase [Balneolales bacterium]|nr:DEAD/DEAH box helicase [Balneolales bacterium]